MAGHSQFKNIMHRKGAQDARRARQFAKLIREITVSARQGLPDPAFNPRLRAAVVAARQANMPKDTVVRAAFGNYGGALGETNSVSFLFARRGVVRYPATAADPDAMLDAAIEAGAEDVDSGPDGHEITCAAEDFFAVRDALEARFGEPEAARLDWRPTTTVAVDEERAGSVMKLLDALEHSDDVQNVYANFEIPEGVMERLSA